MENNSKQQKINENKLRAQVLSFKLAPIGTNRRTDRHTGRTTHRIYTAKHQTKQHNKPWQEKRLTFRLRLVFIPYRCGEKIGGEREKNHKLVMHYLRCV